jgi:peptidoglycan/xylan/chitin deacetylase (PgdA/CDA1 family)
MRSGMAFLMYHEIERPGVPTVESGGGYLRYVLTEADFREHIAALRRSGYTATAVGQALARRWPVGRRVVLTFDDGAVSDRLVAAALLNENGFGATFYVVAGFLNRRGHLSVSHLRELAGLGFEIGSHSMSHRWLSDLDTAGLRDEIVNSKDRLQQVLGAPVQHFACPGGRLSRAAVRLAREAGYLSLATSQLGLNDAGTDPFRLRRIAIHRGTSARHLLRLCEGRDLAFRRVREGLLHAAKAAMGNRRYDKVRTMLLDRAGIRPAGSP